MKSLSVRKKLVLNALLAVATTVGVGVAGYLGIVTVVGAMDDIVANTATLRQQMITDMRHDTLRTDVYVALYESALENTGERMVKATHEHGVDMMKALDSAHARATGNVKPLLAKARPALERYVASAEGTVRLAFSDRPSAVEKLPEFEKVFIALEADLEDISDAIEGGVAASQAAGERAVQLAKLIIGLVCLLAAAGLTGISFVLARAILGPLDRAVNASVAVASGDLTVSIESKRDDEIGRLLRSLEKMRADLAAAVHEIQSAARNVNTGSREIARGNADLSSRTEEQASSLQQTASSMEEITATAQKNTESARQASELAGGVSLIASRGSDAVRDVVTTMGGISDASRRIADITNVIDAIAFQTNILALNAAVEAARAGEHGRGFAVVASEVRALAQRSGTAAKEIKGLIDESVGRVSEGTRQVDGAGRTMEELLASMQRVTNLMTEIAEASDEQLRGIEQVSQAVSQMDQVVQQNAALVEESAAASENLASQAELMASTVGRFKLEQARYIGPAANEPLKLLA